MRYNLNQFGDIFRALRKTRGYSYNALAKEAGIAKNTLRNIERGKVTPTIETLSILSNYLDVDLTTLFLTCKTSTYQHYDDLHRKFERTISNHKTDFITQYMQEAEDLIRKTSHITDDPTLQKRTLQLYYRMIGHYETYIKREDEAALLAFNNALMVTMPDFQLHTYSTFDYNYEELHILFNIVQMLDRKEKIALHMTMYHFIYDRYSELVEKEIYLLPTLVNNLAVSHLNNGDLDQALKLANIGLTFISKQQTTIDLPALLLCKGLVFYYQKNPYADFYIDLSFDLLVLGNRSDIIELALKDLNQRHHIDYELKTKPVTS